MPKSKELDIRALDLPRKVVSHMTSKSWREVPHVSYIYEPDITDLLAEFRALSEAFASRGQKITFNTLMLKIIAEGIKAAPILNSSIEYSAGSVTGKITANRQINISIPWLLEDGKIITPSICDVNDMSLLEISDKVNDISKRLKNTNINELLYKTAMTHTIEDLKKGRIFALRRVLAAKLSRHPIKGLSGKAKQEYYDITPEERLTEKDILSASVTVSNIGSLHKGLKGHFSLLEIVPPQVFVAGIGAIQEKPSVFIGESGEKEIGIRKILPICLAFDHRAMDFISLVPFMERLDEIFENPQQIRLW